MTNVTLKSGDLVYSKYFGGWVEITKVDSDTDWYFEHQSQILKAQTPLSYFIKNKTYKLCQRGK